MKPLIQKLPLNEATSFVAKTFRTPHFEVGWHQHIEYELILFTEGSGMSFIGNYVGEFETGVMTRIMGPVTAALFGGVGSLVVTGLWIKLFPDLWKTDRLE